MNLQLAREKLGNKLGNVSEIASGILRAVRRHGDQELAAYVFDLNDRIPGTVGELNDYLDDVIGPTYFNKDASLDLRWNNYLYFVVGKGVAASPGFQTIKENLETDRSYARKFVVVEDEFDRVLSELDSIASVGESLGVTDVVQSWSERLGAGALEDVLDQDRPVADVVRRISSGAAKHTLRTKKATGVDASKRLVESHLLSIDLQNFRRYPKGRSISFGKANLLFGPNGVGKTSLLEGLEFLYCGGNRRSAAPESAIVEGVLASGQAVKTAGVQALSDFKTRQRLWYGSDDNSRQNKLPNQFARFNFLNTDAAAELSLLKEDPKATADSLAALLSGHEATVIWRRIQDVRKAVAEEMRSKRSERALAESEAKAKEEQRRTLLMNPVQSDAAFSVLRKDLERARLRRLPKDKQAVSVELVESLSELASRLRAIRRIDWVDGPLTIGAVAQEAVSLLTVWQDLQAQLSVKRDCEMRRRVLTQRQGVASARLTALKAIPPSAHAELSELSSTLSSVADELAQIAPAVAALPTARPPAGWEATWGQTGVPEALATSNAALQAISQQLDNSKARLDELARAHSELHNAMAELRAWAEKVLEHGHSDSTCPLCGTVFQGGELIPRMKSIALTPADTAMSELRRHVNQLISQQTLASEQSTWLGQLERFRRAVSHALPPFSVADTQQFARTLLQRHEVLRGARETATERVNAYARAGLTLNAIEQLCVPIEGDDSDRPVAVDVIGAVAATEKFLEKVRLDIVALVEREKEVDEALRLRLASVQIPPSGSLAASLDLLRARRQIAEDANSICGTLEDVLDLDSTSDLSTLAAPLEAAVLDAKKVRAAADEEGRATTQLATLARELHQLSDRITKVHSAIERLSAALRVLDETIENQSLDAANAAVVAATHNVADSIFRRIHVPDEYMITADPDSPLKRRDKQSSIQLTQVSTGQRAAYALSMFLAMNAQVKEGPKAILLDDPISHVDDLNALSFLDYLRNLVLRSDRQIFFATADEKIAGLFAHKFGFLNGEFKTIELTRT